MDAIMCADLTQANPVSKRERCGVADQFSSY